MAVARDQITVTRIGSTIGTNKKKYKEACLRGLGLGRIGTSRTLEDTPAVRGVIGKVAHLVRVEEYQRVETRSRRGEPAEPRAQKTYIWEQDAWPEFTWDEQTLTPLMTALENKRTALRKRFDDQGLGNDKQNAIASEISNLLDAPDKHPGVPEVMLDATQNYNTAINKERICGWHEELFPDGIGDGDKIVTGDWRRPEDDPMVVVYYKAIGKGHVLFEAPPANRIPSEADRLFRWIATQAVEQPVLAAGVVHLWFLTIHPFENGNGRIARAITEAMLARAEDNPIRLYSVASQIQANRKDYDFQIEWTQKGELDITSWLESFLEKESAAIEQADTALTYALRRMRFWEQHADDQLGARQIKVMNKVLDNEFQGKLTTKKWAKMAKCSTQTAAADINDLIERGALFEDPERKREPSYKVSGDE